MKKLSIFILVGLVLCSSALAIGALSPRDVTEIEIEKEQQDILEAKGLLSPTISEMVCDGTTCRSCSSVNVGNETDPVNYGMGCVSFPQTYCSSYNETVDGNNETTGECLTLNNRTDTDLQGNESEAYKVRWEGIADVIVEREAIVYDAKFGAGNVTISEVK